MTIFRALTLSLALLIAPSLDGQKASRKITQKPVETTVCKVFDNPSAFNNKLVKVRGYLLFGEETSVLLDDGCPSKAIWFWGWGDATLPGAVAKVQGTGNPANKNSGQRTAPILPVQVVRDSNFEEFARYMHLNAKAAECSTGPAPDLEHLSECTTYRITATFTGRLDGVSKEVHEAHLQRKSGEGTDWKGFGHMGEYDAQIVVQSVQDVVAVDELEIRDSNTKPQ